MSDHDRAPENSLVEIGWKCLNQHAKIISPTSERADAMNGMNVNDLEGLRLMWGAQKQTLDALNFGEDNSRRRDQSLMHAGNALDALIASVQAITADENLSEKGR